MQNLVKLDAVFSEERGLEVKTQVIPVVKEGSKAVVLDTEDFKTVYKGKPENEYQDYVGVSKTNTPFTLGNLIGVSGYFDTKEEAEKVAVDEVNKWLVGKIDYYNTLRTKFLTQNDI